MEVMERESKRDASNGLREHGRVVLRSEGRICRPRKSLKSAEPWDGAGDGGEGRKVARRNDAEISSHGRYPPSR